MELQDTFVSSPEQLRQLAIYNGQGNRLQLADIAEVVETTGADRINHVDLERSITLTVSVEGSPFRCFNRENSTRNFKPLTR